MKTLASYLFLGVLMLCLSPHHSQAAQRSQVFGSINKATMVAISPLLTISAIGFKARLTAKEGSPLPFYARTEFLVFAMVLLFVIFCKDTIGELFPLAKKPLDALDVIQNKAMFVATAATLLPGIAHGANGDLTAGLMQAWQSVVPIGTAWASPGTVAGTPIWLDTVTYWIAYALAAAGFYSVWTASHLVNVLGLLAPVPLVGPVLKAIRLGILTVLVSATTVHPLLGVAMSGLILLVAIKMVRWASRLMLFGGVAGLDI